MTSEAGKPEFVDTVITVRYAETDKMGVVYYANYLVWFEVGRVAWCRAKGFSYRDMETEDGRFMVVAEASCRYKAPARFEDDIIIRTSVGSATEKVIRFLYEVINRKSGQLLASGATVHVVTGLDLKPSRIPSHYKRYFALPE